ncbi:MAG: maleylpyruvate isomerase N-terminal domain-containing protein [Ilumatobacteraceae bacterium]
MSHLADLGLILPAYSATRERIVHLLRTASTDDANRQVPACPEWTVADLAAHIAGLAEDIIAGRVEGAGTDPWNLMRVLSGRRTAEQITALGLDATAIISPMTGSPVSAPTEPVE